LVKIRKIIGWLLKQKILCKIPVHNVFFSKALKNASNMRSRIRLVPVFVFATLVLSCEPGKMSLTHQDKTHEPPLTLVIHGGAGTIRRDQMSAEREAAYRKALEHALDTGYSVLYSGGKSVDAVIAAISFLEDCPLFNAGKGAVFTYSGKNELDASIMDGSNLKAGAVAGVTTIKNPIQAAYAVMTESEHVMLAGRGAEAFAQEHGLTIVDPSYFVDSTRYQQFLERRKVEKLKGTGSLSVPDPDQKFGTVGAVALDRFGNIAAGTSTGGMSDKRYGRVGDSPIIGAGTYAKNTTCGVSATGWGEFFIRLAVAHDISAMMEYADLSLQEAADNVIMKKIPALGGDGGIIGLDRNGNISLTFNTDGMYRGYIRAKGEAKTFIFKDEREK
jgi:L-asparaginase / beta-aspartyl-peptidase